MHAFLFLHLLSSAYVTVAPSTEDNCPSSTLVESALAIHAPFALSPRVEKDKAEKLTLLLSPNQQNGETSFFLIDRMGKVQLYRTLPAPVGDRKRDCAALADSVAFIVDRYLGEMELPELPIKSPPTSPPASPPRPLETAASVAVTEVEEVKGPPFSPPNARFLIAIELDRRMENEGQAQGNHSLSLMGATRMASWGSIALWLQLGMGVSQSQSLNWPNGTLDVRRFPASLGFIAAYRTGRAEWGFGPNFTMDIHYLRANSRQRSDLIMRWPLAGGLGASLDYSFTTQFFVRASAVGYFGLFHKEFTPESTPNQPLLTTPWFFLDFSFGIGIHL